MAPAAQSGAPAPAAESHSGGGVSLPLNLGTPKVSFRSGSIPRDTANVTVVLEGDELGLLDQFDALRSVDLSGSTCYEEIVAWHAQHPDLPLRYTVTLPDGQVLDNGSESADLSAMDSESLLQAAALLQWLPRLNLVELGTASSDRSLSAEALEAVTAAAPLAEIRYGVSFQGQTYPMSTESLDLSVLSRDQLPEAIEAIRCLPNLKSIGMGAEGGTFTWEDVDAVHAARPEAALDYGFTLLGKELNLADQVLDFRHVKVGDQLNSIRKVLPYMVNCKTLDLDSAGVPTATCAQLRQEFPNVDVVWRINFGLTYSVRTDAERILASKPSKGGELHDSDVRDLVYCNHCKFLDLGHNESLTNVDFCAGMPELEVLVVAMNPVSDISALAQCPKLEYAEIFETSVSDLSPLAELKNLRHLNICNCRNLTDISPLYGLTELERLWIGNMTPISADQVAAMQQAAPECEIDTEVTDPTTGRWRLVGYTELSLLLYDETGWLQEVLHPRYELLREQFGYGDGDFSFYWNDPLYAEG